MKFAGCLINLFYQSSFMYPSTHDPIEVTFVAWHVAAHRLQAIIPTIFDTASVIYQIQTTLFYLALIVISSNRHKCL